MTKTNTRTPAKGCLVCGAVAQPPKDVITQSELQSLMDAFVLHARMVANVRRRIHLGATVERGQLTVASCEEIDSLSGEVAPIKLRAFAVDYDGGFAAGGLDIEKRPRKAA